MPVGVLVGNLILQLTADVIIPVCFAEEAVIVIVVAGLHALGHLGSGQPRRVGGDAVQVVADAVVGVLIGAEAVPRKAQVLRLRSLHDGNERNLIVLTQPESYRKTLTRGVELTAKWLKRKYPAMPKVLFERAKHYNETVCFCHRLAENKPQDTVLLQPEKSLNSFEKDVKKLEWGYEMGYNMTCARMEQIKNLFR